MQTVSGDIERLSDEMSTLSRDVGDLSHDFDLLAARSRHTDETLGGLIGTFSNIENHIRDQGLTLADLLSWKARTDARLDALEKRDPSAARRRGDPSAAPVRFG
jgi:hypothetical protein